MTGQTVSRKKFLASLGVGAAALGLTGLSTPGCSRRGRGAPLALDRGGVRLEGKLYPVYSGSFHYWRHDTNLWPEIFDHLSRLGLNTVCTPVPWETHEIERGRFDFGSRDKRRNLGAFLDLSFSKGFRALVRPGPASDSGLTFCGIPSRVLFDPDIAARTSVDSVEVWHTLDGQFPVPSCFSEKFYEETALFFDAMLPILSARLACDGGPVIGLLLDNGPGFFQRLHYPYTLDYHPAALGLFSKKLAEKYREIANLNRLYSTNYGSFDSVEPPRRFLAETLDDLPAYLDWVEFREWSVSWSLERLSGMLAERGIAGIPLIDTLSEELLLPAGSVTKAADNFISWSKDYLSAGEDYQRKKVLGRALSGMCAYPFNGRLESGFAPAVKKISLETENQGFGILAALMHGMKGWNCHMAVEREGWLGGPVKGNGEVRKEIFEIYQALYRLLREIRFQDFRKETAAVFLLNESLSRLIQAEAQAKTGGELNIGPEVFSEALDLRLSDPPEACLLWVAHTEGLLREAGFDWDYGGTSLGVGKVNSYRVAFFPAPDFIYAGQLASLKDYVAGGGTLIFGPGKPTLNQRMKEDPLVAEFFRRSVTADDFLSGAQAAHPKGGLIHLESPLQVSDLLKALEIELTFTRSNTRIELALHSAPDGRRLLFAANGENTPQRSDIFFQGSIRFRGLTGGESFEREGKIRVELPPCHIEIWEVEG